MRTKTLIVTHFNGGGIPTRGIGGWTRTLRPSSRRRRENTRILTANQSMVLSSSLMRALSLPYFKEQRFNNIDNNLSSKLNRRFLTQFYSKRMCGVKFIKSNLRLELNRRKSKLCLCLWDLFRSKYSKMYKICKSWSRRKILKTLTVNPLKMIINRSQRWSESSKIKGHQLSVKK